MQINERYRIIKQSSEIEAYLHNEGTRLTIVNIGMCSYTFELLGEGQSAKLRYYIESEDLRGIRFEDSLYIQTALQVSTRKQLKPDSAYKAMTMSFHKVSEPWKASPSAAGLHSLLNPSINASSRRINQEVDVDCLMPMNSVKV